MHGEWVGGGGFYTVVFLFFVDSSPRTRFLWSPETTTSVCGDVCVLKKSNIKNIFTYFIYFYVMCVIIFTNMCVCRFLRVCLSPLVLQWGCMSEQVE